MITDSLESCKQYFKINALFEKAFNFALQNIHSLECGHYEIEGDRAFAIVVDSSMKKQENAKLEAHNRYIDIQIPISKEEHFGMSPRVVCSSQIGEFDNEKDICFFNDTPTNIIKVEMGEFIIFLPTDAHAPLIGEGEIRKMIIKIEA